MIRPWIRPASGYASPCARPTVRQPECACGRVGHEQVRAETDPIPDGVLEQSVRDVHGRAEQVGPGPDRLADRGTPMEHHLEVEVRDRGARGADVVVGRDRRRASNDEVPVHRPELLEHTVALAIETERRRGGEDGVTFELDEGEVGRDAFDDAIKEGSEHAVGGRDAGAEVGAVLLLDSGHEAGIAGDVREQEVSLAGGWLGLRLRLGSRCVVHVLPRPVSA